jgi:hypothetical protein
MEHAIGYQIILFNNKTELRQGVHARFLRLRATQNYLIFKRLMQHIDK